MATDIHAHLVAGHSEDNGCYISPDFKTGIVSFLLKRHLGLRGVPDSKLDRVYLEKLINWAENSDLEALGLLALDGVYDRDGNWDGERTALHVTNDYCLWAAEQSDVFFPVASINPVRKDAVVKLEEVAQRGATAIKTLPNSQGFDPADPNHRPFWAKMAELDMPLLTHTSFEHTIPVIDQSYGQPDRLRPALEAGVTVIAAHCASSGVAHLREHSDVWRKMLGNFSNLYGDISAFGTLSRFPYVKKIVDRAELEPRLIYGSDFPVPPHPMLFAPRIGFRRAWQLGRIHNPLQQNLELMRAVGTSEEVLERGQGLVAERTR